MKIWVVVFVKRGVIYEVDLFTDEKSAFDRYDQYESEMDIQDDTLDIFEREISLPNGNSFSETNRVDEI